MGGGRAMKYAIGIDIGGTTVASGVVNENGDLIQQKLVHSDSSDREKMFACVVNCVEELLMDSSIPLDQIYGIGAGIPGKVDRENGVAIFQNNIPWSNFPFVKRIQQVFQVDRIVIDNDVYMAAFAEWKKANLSTEELFVYMTISTGVSCSIIQDGEFIRGNGFAGELGLIPISIREDRQKIERLEQLVSGPALERFAKEKYQDESMTSKKVFQAYYDTDQKAVQLIEDFVATLTQGIYTMNSLLDPHKIVLGGSVATHNPVLLKMIKQELADYLLDEQKHILRNLEISSMGNGQGIIGAGLRVLEDGGS